MFATNLLKILSAEYFVSYFPTKDVSKVDYINWLIKLEFNMYLCTSSVSADIWLQPNVSLKERILKIFAKRLSRK